MTQHREEATLYVASHVGFYNPCNQYLWPGRTNRTSPFTFRPGHAAVDGDSMQRILMTMHDFVAKPPRPPGNDLAPLIKQVVPGNLPLALKAYQNSLQRPFKLVQTARKMIRSQRKISEAVKKGELPEAASNTHGALVWDH